MPDGIEILLLDYEGAARALSLSRAALRDLVYKGRGPRVTKIGRRTFFAVSDLEAFVESCREPVPVTTQEPDLPRQTQARAANDCRTNGTKVCRADQLRPGRIAGSQPVFLCSSFASSPARKSPVRLA